MTLSVRRIFRFAVSSHKYSFLSYLIINGLENEVETIFKVQKQEEDMMEIRAFSDFS